MAEREGFEPSEGITPFAGLANLWFKPLTHLSSLSFIVRFPSKYSLFISISTFTLTYYPRLSHIDFGFKLNRIYNSRNKRFIMIQN